MHGDVRCDWWTEDFDLAGVRDCACGRARGQSAENLKNALTVDESLALTALDESLHPKPYRTAYQKNMAIYQRENRKLRRVLHGTKKVTKVRPSVQSVQEVASSLVAGL